MRCCAIHPVQHSRQRTVVIAPLLPSRVTPFGNLRWLHMAKTQCTMSSRQPAAAAITSITTIIINGSSQQHQHQQHTESLNVVKNICHTSDGQDPLCRDGKDDSWLSHGDWTCCSNLMRFAREGFKFTVNVSGLCFRTGAHIQEFTFHQDRHHQDPGPPPHFSRSTGPPRPPPRDCHSRPPAPQPHKPNQRQAQRRNWPTKRNRRRKQSVCTEKNKNRDSTQAKCLASNFTADKLDVGTVNARRNCPSSGKVANALATAQANMVLQRRVHAAPQEVTPRVLPHAKSLRK